MIQIASSLLAILVAVTAPLALACFPTPDAKPTSEVTELRLPQRPTQPAVIYTAGNYAIYMKPQDLLDTIKGHGSGQFGIDGFAGRLKSLLPLDSDTDVHEILAALAPEMPKAGERTERALRYRRFWQQSERQLHFDIARLLEHGLAAVIETSSGKTLVGVKRNEYSELCFGGRKFIAPAGAVILHTSDWVS